MRSRQLTINWNATTSGIMESEMSLIIPNEKQRQGIEMILHERNRQDAKWGTQRGISPTDWVTILMEEVGELAAAILGETFGTDKNPELDWRKEAIQVAAVALAMVEQNESTISLHREQREIRAQTIPS